MATMERIMIIGPGGAGKSTLARELGAALGLEVIHLDSLYWRPGWVPTPKEEWKETIRHLAERPEGIIDGNYGGVADARYDWADTVIFLDFPRLLCLWRVCRRVLSRRPRPDLAPGCPERLDPSFLKWIWDFPRLRRPAILARLEHEPQGKRIVRLRSPAEARRFLDRCRPNNSPVPAKRENGSARIPPDGASASAPRAHTHPEESIA